MSENSIKDIYELSPLQEGLLFHSLLNPDADAYFRQVSYRLHGQLDVSLIERSFNVLSERHDALRTVFNYSEDRPPLQIVLKKREVDFHFKDLIESGKNSVEKQLKEFKQKDRDRSFDLSKDVLIRISLFRLEDGLYELIWSDHHILMDGWCRSILAEEFVSIYSDLLNGRQSVMPKPTPFSEYITWLGKQDKAASLDYWSDYLKGYQTLTGLPKLQPTDIDGTFQDQQLELRLERSTRLQLENMATDHNTTLNVMFSAIWGLIIAKYNNCNDVVFGAVVSGRPPEIRGIEKMVGLFINTIPVRISFDENQTFSSLLDELNEQTIESKSHHYCQLAEIQSSSSLKQNLFNHILVFENLPEMDKKGSGEADLGFDISYEGSYERTNYDLDVAVGLGSDLTIKFTFNENVYHPDFIKGFFDQIKVFVKQIIENSGILIKGEFDC
ncbi:MAG: condensation domain-containing protein [Bacteroidota bacterium]